MTSPAIAFGAGGEGQRHAMAQHRRRQRHAHRRSRARSGRRAARARGTASISAWLARGPGPQATCFFASAPPSSGRPGAHQRQDRLDHAFADRNAPHQALRRDQLVGGQHRRGVRLVGAGGGEQHPPLGVEIGIADVDLQQEAVELRLGQRIGAFLLQRVLRRQHMERARQRMILAGDRDAAFLHRLQQRRLGARAGAVDLVGHQQLAEHRARDEAERARGRFAFLQHFRAENVGRHQIGRALDALVVEAEHDAQRLDQPRLGEAGHADQQRMAAGQQRDQGLIDHLALAEDDVADLLAHSAEPLAERFRSRRRDPGGGGRKRRLSAMLTA